MSLDTNLDPQSERTRAGGRRRLSILRLVMAGIVVSFIGVLSWAATNNATADVRPPSGAGRISPSASSPSSGYLQGAQAPDFTYTLFDGTELTISSLRGRPVVLNFWASWCPPCRDEAPTLEKGWEAYKGKGVQFLGVDIQDTEEDARAFMKEFGITYPNGQDTTSGIAASYGLTGVPETFFINGDGKIVRHWIGPIEDKQLSIVIEGMLQ